MLRAQQQHLERIALGSRSRRRANVCACLCVLLIPDVVLLSTAYARTLRGIIHANFVRTDEASSSTTHTTTTTPDQNHINVQ